MYFIIMVIQIISECIGTDTECIGTDTEEVHVITDESMGIDEYMGTDDLMAIEETADNRNQETQTKWSMNLHDSLATV